MFCTLKTRDQITELGWYVYITINTSPDNKVTPQGICNTKVIELTKDGFPHEKECKNRYEDNPDYHIAHRFVPIPIFYTNLPTAEEYFNSIIEG